MIYLFMKINLLLIHLYLWVLILNLCSQISGKAFTKYKMTLITLNCV